MVHKRMLGMLAILCIANSVGGCPRKTETPAAAPEAKTDPKDPDPHWVIQQKPPAKVALVFVHGVTGDHRDRDLDGRQRQDFLGSCQRE